MLRLSCILFLWVPFAATTYTPCDNCTDRVTPSQLANISLRLYQSFDDYESVLVGEADNLLVDINNSEPTVVYVHGWTETPLSTSVETVVKAYLERTDHNVIVVDWHEIAAHEYDYCVKSTSGVGYTVATALNGMVASGLNSTTSHVVGHSLGGQAAGSIGKYVNFTLPRITGLDPAGPHLTKERLTDTDAEFVDIIHTDPGFLGINNSAGSIDFWPNGRAGIQPGTENYTGYQIYCQSHYKSWKYYAESLLNEEAFIGLECDSYESFATGSCSSNAKVVMGYATPTTASGDYYLRTNGASPYGRGSTA